MKTAIKPKLILILFYGVYKEWIKSGMCGFNKDMTNEDKIKVIRRQFTN